MGQGRRDDPWRTTNANSVFALASIRSDGQAQMIWRSSTGAEAQASELVGGMGFPKWVKIVRSGNRFSAYYKVNDGDEWSQMGASQLINMTANTQVGLIVCSHHDGFICQAQFDQVTLQSVNQSSGSDSPSSMNIELINTGSELMLGRVLNTHQQWLCRRLADMGHVVSRQVAIADNGQEIQQAVREALGRADLVITTGGLGPDFR